MTSVTHVDIFFNQSGFHNHIAHHLCTLYALKASPEIIEKQYDLNKTYQRSPVPLDKDVTGSFHEKEHYKEHLGDERYYHDYLQFFQQEIEAKGWKDVVNEYLFAGDERADDMLVRVFSGAHEEFRLIQHRLADTAQDSYIPSSILASESNSINQPSSPRPWRKQQSTVTGSATCFSPPNSVLDLPPSPSRRLWPC